MQINNLFIRIQTASMCHIALNDDVKQKIRTQSFFVNVGAWEEDQFRCEWSPLSMKRKGMMDVLTAKLSS